MIKFEKITPGMTLFDVRKARWPSPVRYSVWQVSVKQVDTINRRVLASWNGNQETWMDERSITQYRATRPAS